MQDGVLRIFHKKSKIHVENYIWQYVFLWNIPENSDVKVIIYYLSLPLPMSSLVQSVRIFAQLIYLHIK